MNMQIFLIFIIVGILIISILSIFHLINKNKKQQRYYNDRITKQNYDITQWKMQSNQWQQNYNQVNTQYTNFTMQIEEENAAKKEVEKRRRVSPKKIIEALSKRLENYVKQDFNLD